MNRNQRRSVLKMFKKKPRPEPEIQGEYATLCAQYGELIFNIGVLEGKARELSDQIGKLNAEYRRAKEGNKDAVQAPTKA